MDYTELVMELLETKREDDYWDFKETWHNNKADLIHDIICLSNNRVDRDAYLIMGIRDKTYEIIGIENDENRKTQQNVIDLLNEVSFISGIRPSIEVRTIYLENHQIDILIIKNSYDTPYYITKEYRDKNRCVNALYIYTRVKDTNTPINKNADINQIEYLWKKRFRLVSSPIIQFFQMIKSKKEWEERYDIKTNEIIYHNVNRPEFTISIKMEDEEGAKEYYCYVQTDKRVFYEELVVKYFGTEIYSTQAIELDGRRFLTVVLDNSYIHLEDNKNYDYTYKYLIMKSETYYLQQFLYDKDKSDHRDAFYKHQYTYLEFYTESEKINFEAYLFENKKEIINKIKEKKADKEKCIFDIDSNNDNELYKKIVAERLIVAEVFNSYLEKYRQEKSQ